jgi:hypothetical protein
MKTWDDINPELEERFRKDPPAHEIVWYIQKPLTLDQWIELDDKMWEVFEETGIGDETVGFAGPIPFPEGEENG